MSELHPDPAEHSHGDHSRDAHAHTHDAHGHDAHGHGEDERSFDWAAAADAIELDAEVMRPVVDAALARVDLTAASRLLDLGSGPGVMANLMARLAPGAQVVAVDGSPQLLERAEATAVANGVHDRFRTRQVDLDAVAGDELARLLIDAGGPFDLVWASMVLHHVTDAPGVLRALHDTIVPGGTIVLAEFGGVLEIFPEGSADPVATSGAWARWSVATAEAIRDHLPDGATELRWDEELRAAGFVDVTSELVAVEHGAPLDEPRRAWLAWFLGNGLGHGGSRLSEADRSAMQAFVERVGDGDRSGDGGDAEGGPVGAELVISTSRTLLTARRPG